MEFRPVVLVLVLACLAAPACAQDRAARRGETFVNLTDPSAPRVLFDDAHAQTAGNADWIITGGYSDVAQTLRRAGFSVEALGGKPITRERLAGVRVVVLPEPNRPYAAGELEALAEHVQSGGGLLAIGDHKGSDRDGDGWDAPMVLNQLIGPMGLQFSFDKVSEAPLSGPSAGALAQGVKAAGAWAGCSVTLVSPAARAHLTFGPKAGGKPFLASSTFGKGRLVAVGDSSPFDDGSGTPGKKLHDNYNDPRYSGPQIAVNVVSWLAGREGHVVDER